MSITKRSKILIVGTGAVGGFYGGKLAEAGQDVSTLCRSDYEIVKSEGIKVKSCSGDFAYRPAQVVKYISDYRGCPDYVIVTLKSLPNIDVSELIGPAVAPSTSIVLIQNGIGIETVIRDNFPDNELVSGLAFICVSRIKAGEIHHQEYGRLVLGLYPNGASENVELLVELFINSGVHCTISHDVIRERWKKLLWNASFNTISVLTGADTKSILDNKYTAELVLKIMKEVQTVATVSGHDIESSVLQKYIDDTRKMKPYRTSMLLDYEAGKKMEIEAILGNTIAIAQKYSTQVTNLKCLYGLLMLINNNLNP